MRLASTARAGVTDPLVRADLDRLRGRIEFVAGSVPVGVGIWSQAARDVVATDPQRAREIGMIATAGSTFLAEQDRTDLDPAELLASTAQDSSTRARCFTHLLTGFHQLNHDGLAAAAVSLRQAVTLGRDLSETDLLTNLGIATFHLGDDEGFRRLFSRMLTQARNDGAIGLVLFALPRLALADLSGGNWTGAVAHATEAVELARSTGQPGLAAMPLAQLALVAALRGDQGYDGLLAELDRVTAGAACRHPGCADAGHPAVGAGLPRSAHRGTRGRAAPLRADDPTHADPACRLRPVGRRRPNRSPRHRREVADRAGTIRRQ